jgi:inhibitor of cysteine peptidase
MKTAARLFLLTVVAASAAALVTRDVQAWTGDKTVTITDKDADKKVELSKGDKLQVKLPANPTTGFTWVIASGESDAFKSKGKPAYEPADKDKKVAGGAGTQTFTFDANAAGETEIVMHYKRVFEKDKEPAKTFKFKVVVK